MNSSAGSRMGSRPRTAAEVRQAVLERTCLVIKPHANTPETKAAILARVAAAGFSIIKEKEYTMSAKKAGEFYKEQTDSPQFNELVESITRYFISCNV